MMRPQSGEKWENKGEIEGENETVHKQLLFFFALQPSIHAGE